MQAYPHHYLSTATAQPQGLVRLESPGLTPIDSAPPAAFDGPGDQWSPETLLCAAIADCTILTFRVVARMAKLEWRALSCEVHGTLERIEGRTSFTRFVTHATLTVPEGTSEAAARAALEKSKGACLVSNSLSGSNTMEITLVFA